MVVKGSLMKEEVRIFNFYFNTRADQIEVRIRGTVKLGQSYLKKLSTWYVSIGCGKIEKENVSFKNFRSQAKNIDFLDLCIFDCLLACSHRLRSLLIFILLLFS